MRVGGNRAAQGIQRFHSGRLLPSPESKSKTRQHSWRSAADLAGYAIFHRPLWSLGTENRDSLLACLPVLPVSVRTETGKTDKTRQGSSMLFRWGGISSGPYLHPTRGLLKQEGKDFLSHTPETSSSEGSADLHQCQCRHSCREQDGHSKITFSKNVRKKLPTRVE